VSGDGDLDYALARIAARRARRPASTTWRALESLRGFAPALAAAREGGHAERLAAIDAHSGPRRIEVGLRAAWRRELATLAGWMPARWRPALDACAGWFDLPRLRAGVAADDPDAPALHRLRAALPAGHATVDAAWWAMLRDRLRAAGAGADPAFARLGGLLAAHRARFAALPAGNGWPLREELEASLLAFMHGAPGPAAAFAWVALIALEHERLRGLLLPRAVREAAA
jgi:hypothetical protein